MTKKLRVAIIHHNADMDGKMSGALGLKMFQYILSKYIDIDFELIGYNYGKDDKIDTWLDPNNSAFDYYQFIDITPPLFWWDRISGFDTNVHIFDHHKPAYDEILENIKQFSYDTNVRKYFFDTKMSGAKIYYQTLFDTSLWIEWLVNLNAPKLSVKWLLNKNKILKNINEIFGNNTGMELFVDTVSSYDIWDWYDKRNEPSGYYPLALNEYFDGKTVEKIHYDIFVHYVNDVFMYSNAEKTLAEKLKITKSLFFDQFLKEGFDYITSKLKYSANKKYYSLYFNNVKIIITQGYGNFYDTEHIKNLINKDPKSIFIGAKCIISYDIDFVKHLIKFSFRAMDQNDDFDVCLFAKEMCGKDNAGGHKKASGGSLPINEFNDFISKLLI